VLVILGESPDRRRVDRDTRDVVKHGGSEKTCVRSLTPSSAANAYHQRGEAASIKRSSAETHVRPSAHGPRYTHLRRAWSDRSILTNPTILLCGRKSLLAAGIAFVATTTARRIAHPPALLSGMTASTLLSVSLRISRRSPTGYNQEIAITQPAPRTSVIPPVFRNHETVAMSGARASSGTLKI
jgi:hypothetical protein